MPRLTKAEYEIRVKAIAADAEEVAGAAAAADELTGLGAIVATMETMVHGLEGLEPPEEVEQAHEDFAAVLAFIVRERARPLAEAVRRGDMAEAARLDDLELPEEIVERTRRSRETFATLRYDIGDDPFAVG